MCDYLLWQHEYRKRWITYTEEEIGILNTAVQKTQKSASLPNKNESKKIVVDFEKMIQKNQATLYEQRIRCLVSSSGLFVWLWKDNNDDWHPYKPNLIILLEVALTNGDKEFTFYDGRRFEVNLTNFEQLNTETREICPVKREKIRVSTTVVLKSVKDLSLAEIAVLRTSKPLSNKRKRPGAVPDNKPPINTDSNAPSTSFKPMDIDSASSPPVPCAHASVPVDSECPEKGTYHLYCKGKTIFSATLNQTNLQNNNNKYYIIQLLEQNNSAQYAVWRRWGRVGNKGQRDFTLYGTSLSNALNAFEKKFHEKTLNNWSDADRFDFIHGKYDLLQTDLIPDSEVEKVKQNIVSKLPISVKNLIEIICDQQRMKEIMEEMLYDSGKTPLGKLTLKQVRDGYIALNRIALVLSSGADRGSALISACNDFYTKIPHNFGMKTPPLIRTQEDIDDKLNMLEALSNIAVAMGVIKDSSGSIEHPLDKYYHSLNCSIEELDPGSPEYNELNICLQGTHGVTHSAYEMEIISAFKCHKSQQDYSFKGSQNTKYLLWHGSRITNWVGILKKGLCIAPPEAPVTGYMFGKGIYFADSSSKSANYCFATRKMNEGLLLLCEVSVGDIYYSVQSDGTLPSSLPPHESVLGLGRFRPSKFETSVLSRDATVAYGPLKEERSFSGSLIYNEYIVYDIRQVKMKYLIRIRFNYK